ncbi:MAG: hypothetical protein LW808_001610 [Verrucomicrobiota bacterium]|nr:MAG: hypothetical protein LW808_001610 [Verrucomicrobiota bacterium]
MSQKVLRKIAAVVVALIGMICDADAGGGSRKKSAGVKPSASCATRRGDRKGNPRTASERDREVSPLGQSLGRLENAQPGEILEAMKNTHNVLISMCKSKIKMESVDLWRMFDVLAQVFPHISRRGLERYNAVGVISDIERTVVPKLATISQVRDKAKQKVDNLSWVIGRSYIPMPKQFRKPEDPKRAREQEERAHENLLRKVQWRSFVADEKASPTTTQKKATIQTKTTPKPPKPRSSNKKS